MIDTLDNIKINKQVLINKIKGEDILKRRLLDLGFIPGVKTECVLISPFKDPKAYIINNNLIAIRNKDAKNIEVYYEEN